MSSGYATIPLRRSSAVSAAFAFRPSQTSQSPELGLGFTCSSEAERKLLAHSGGGFLRFTGPEEWIVPLPRNPEFVQQHPQLPSHRDKRSFPGILSASLTQPEAPAFQSTVRRSFTHDDVRAFHQQPSQVPVSRLGDSQLRVALSTLTLPRT